MSCPVCGQEAKVGEWVECPDCGRFSVTPALLKSPWFGKHRDTIKAKLQTDPRPDFMFCLPHEYKPTVDWVVVTVQSERLFQPTVGTS